MHLLAVRRARPRQEDGIYSRRPGGRQSLLRHLFPGGPSVWSLGGGGASRKLPVAASRHVGSRERLDLLRCFSRCRTLHPPSLRSGHCGPRRLCLCMFHPAGAENRQGRYTGTFFSGAAFLAFLAFVPWCFYLVPNISQATGNLGWSQQKVGLLSLVGMWGFNYSSLFVDLNHSVRFIEQYDVPLFLDYIFRAGVLVVLSSGLAFLARRVSHRPRIFLLALIVIPFLTLAVPDLLMGGMRSGGGHRYLIPSYLGVTIAVAALLGEGVSSPSSRERRCRWLLGVLLCSGIVSLVVHASADTWWTKPVSYYAPRVARIVNQSPHPLLISDVSVNMLSMSYLLEPSVRVLPVRNPDLLHIPAGFRDIFVFAPSQTLFARIRAERGFTLIELDRRGRLWLLRSDIRSRDG